jgi:phenylalanine-4-hydroxylase
MTLSKGLVEINEVLDKLPHHLMNLVIDQPYNGYTSQDHALWRFVMRQNVRYLSKVAHGSYLDGLGKTGISIDEIPHMYGMNRILKEIGWAAVAVDGFIPPSAFMEFQAYNVLVIAADIRPIDQIAYTPAPDIIHEAAGHAPIIADENYASYLQLFGEIGSKAFSSANDYRLYEAIRHLSILKADPYTPEKDIKEAWQLLETTEKSMGAPSEMAKIRNLHWWTVEYGLIGTPENPKIYGAGLLSSIGESYSCLKDHVKKLPYTIDACNVGFDITTPQPQLFVTPGFEHLTAVLKEFAEGMALSKGGIEGMQMAIDSENTGTAVFSSGLQVSGTFTEMITNNGQVAFLKTTGPTALAFDNTELPGHGKSYHSAGFSSPAGKLKGQKMPLELFSDADLADAGIKEGYEAYLEFDSGITVKGTLIKVSRKQNKIILLSFSDCIVRYQDRILFEPSWGVFDMAVGEKIISAFSGPADANAFELGYPVPAEKTHKIVHAESSQKLFDLYSRIREIRNNGLIEDLHLLWVQIKSDYPDEWLLIMELLEITEKSDQRELLRPEIKAWLENIKTRQPELTDLIKNGFEMIYS